MMKSIKEKVMAWISEKYPNGYDVYADADEELDSASINEILKAQHPKDTLESFVMEAYLDIECDVYTDIWNEMQEDMELTQLEAKYMDDHYDEFMEVIKENLAINLPFDHFREQEVCSNLVLDNGDATTDFSYHDCYPHYESDGFHHNLSRKSGMMLAAHLQGYSTKQFRKIFNRYKVAVSQENTALMEEITKAHPFVASCYEELDSCTSSMSAFVICIKLTLGELIDFAEEKKDVKISHTVDCVGLIDFWNGAGGSMEVVLEKDMVVPKDHIFALLPDDAWNRSDDGVYTGYGITEIYGMCESAWKRAS